MCIYKLCTLPHVWTWHDAKSEWIYQDRGIDFAYALRIFVGRYRVRRSDRNGERRYLAVGMIDGKHYTIVYTKRVEDGELVRRVISARRAWDNEQKAFDASR